MAAADQEARAQQTQASMASIVDMGCHMLQKLPGLQLIVQLLVPGLEERARALPPLNSQQHTPGQAPPLNDGCL